MFLSEWREFPSAPCLAGGVLMTARVSMLLKSRASLTHASELVSFLVGLRTYQHPGNLPLQATQSNIAGGLNARSPHCADP